MERVGEQTEITEAAALGRGVVGDGKVGGGEVVELGMEVALT